MVTGLFLRNHSEYALTLRRRLVFSRTCVFFFALVRPLFRVLCKNAVRPFGCDHHPQNTPPTPQHTNPKTTPPPPNPPPPPRSRNVPRSSFRDSWSQHLFLTAVGAWFRQPLFFHFRHLHFVVVNGFPRQFLPPRPRRAASSFFRMIKF